MKPVWEAENISKSYLAGHGMGKKRKVNVLQDLSLAVAAGEILALVGESGSGKSTLARLALALEKPDAGSLRFQGKSYAKWGDRKSLYRHIQMVFQGTAESANPQWLAKDVIAEPLVHLMTSLSAAEREARVESAALQARFPRECLRKPIAALSGGERQRACIARALAVEPEFLVLDEPTSGLDAVLQEQILCLLRDLAQNYSVSMLLITHDLHAAEAYAHRIAFLSRGAIAGTVESTRVASRSHPHSGALYETNW